MRAGWLTRIIVAGVCLGAASAAWADGRYKLAYWYEVGYEQNSNNHSVYVHVFDINGNRLGNKRVEDVGNPGAIFGITNNDPNDKLGFVEIPLYSSSPSLRVNDSGLPSDVTPQMVENRAPNWGHYSWECGFMLVPDGTTVNFDQTLIGTPNKSGSALTDLDAPFTASCAYYDVNPFNFDSDAFNLDSSASSFGQTFVANGDRVVMAKFQVTVGFLQDVRYKVQIREGGPTGTVVGPFAASRLMKSDEYYTQCVLWPTSGPSSAPVVPGNTYYAEIVRADQPGTLNSYHRNNNVYPSGQMYRNGSAVSNLDMIGRVVCATVPPTTPLIQLSTAALNPSSTSCGGPANQSFTVANSGIDTLNYLITADQPWVLVSPMSGSSTGEPDTITAIYKTGGLTAGAHAATITVADENAANSPRTISVNLNVVVRSTPGDFDGDCDVDQVDFGILQGCYTGAGVEQTDLACAATRLDPDVDVDTDDCAIFLRCVSGPDVAGNPDCGN
jgi:hypothetical protein